MLKFVTAWALTLSGAKSNSKTARSRAIPPTSPKAIFLLIKFSSFSCYIVLTGIGPGVCLGSGQPGHPSPGCDKPSLPISSPAILTMSLQCDVLVGKEGQSMRERIRRTGNSEEGPRKIFAQ